MAKTPGKPDRPGVVAIDSHGPLLLGSCYAEGAMLMAVDWRDSTTYQAILREGRNKGLIEGRNEGRVSGAQRLRFIWVPNDSENPTTRSCCHRGDSGSRADRPIGRSNMRPGQSMTGTSGFGHRDRRWQRFDVDFLLGVSRKSSSGKLPRCNVLRFCLEYVRPCKAMKLLEPPSMNRP